MNEVLSNDKIETVLVGLPWQNHRKYGTEENVR